MLDRLMLDEDRIRNMVDGLRAVAEQEDPVGQVLGLQSNDTPKATSNRLTRNQAGVS